MKSGLLLLLALLLNDVAGQDDSSSSATRASGQLGSRDEAQSPAQLTPWSRQVLEALPPERRSELEQRRSEFERLSPEVKEEMWRRHQALVSMRRDTWSHLDREQRARLDTLPPIERLEALDALIERRIEEKHAKLQREHPDLFAEIQSLPLVDRIQTVRKFMEGRRRDKLMSELERGVNLGWIGPKQLEYYREVPLFELSDAVNDFKRAEKMRWARNRGFFQQFGLNEMEQRRLLQMSYPEFKQSFHLLREGVPKEWVFPRGNNGRSGPGGMRPWLNQDRPPGQRPGMMNRPGMERNMSPEMQEKMRERQERMRQMRESKQRGGGGKFISQGG